jgi:peptide/nickel transport system permease protein
MGLTVSYVLRRVGMFVLIIWITATLNFAIIHMAPGDPVGAMIGRLSQKGANISGSAEIITHYRQEFGLDSSIPIQYLKYLGATCHLDLGYSLSNFPTRVTDIIGAALPWTVGLLVTATLIAFAVGTLLGALMVWRATPRMARLVLPPLMVLAAIPYYLLAILLLYVFGFLLGLFPVSGATGLGGTAGLTFQYVRDIIDHATLPALSIILTAIGGWMLGMRAMMVTVVGSDYLVLAEAKGLRERRIFMRYAIRNAILPQVTSLAISLGYVASGAVLVEVIFGYPGIGSVLYTAIADVDYTLIEGVALILVIFVAFAVLVLDLLYPMIDPRITYQRR